MRIVRYLIAGALSLLPAVISAQQTPSDFDSFRRQRTEDFRRFKENKQSEFAEFMRQKWTEYELFSGRSRPELPGPQVIPPADPDAEIKDRPIPVKEPEREDPADVPTGDPDRSGRDRDDTSEEYYTTPVPRPVPTLPDGKEPTDPLTLPPTTPSGTPPVTLPTPLPTPRPTPAPEPDSPSGQGGSEKGPKVTVSALGHDLELAYDPSFVRRMGSVSEDAAADFWKALSQTRYAPFVSRCDQIKRQLGLNDWGFFLLVKDAASRIYPPRMRDEQTAFTAFILDCAGYRVRLASDASYGSLILLLSTSEEMYEIPFYTFSDGKYYVVTANNSSGSILSYGDWQGRGTRKSVGLTIAQQLRPASSGLAMTTINTSVMNGPVDVLYNTHAVDFYNRMPDCDLSVHLNSECSFEVSESLLAALRERIAGRSKTEQVSMLLSFVHQGFPYMVDDKQFGYEKFFFYEDMFAYPYSDCEDNTALFTYLVRKLTGLSAVGLMYDDHASAAVCFEDDVPGGYVTYKGRKYTICDPTYFGARIGQVMPDYVGKSAEIVPIG